MYAQRSLVVVVSIVVAVADPLSTAHADEGKKSKVAKFDKSIVPYGESWYCAGYDDAYTWDAVCVRDEDMCNRIRDAVAEERPYTPITACFEQAKAAAFTYWNVMKDRMDIDVYPTFEYCKRARSSRARKRDEYRKVSTCTLTGARKEPPPKPLPSLCVELVRAFGSYVDCPNATEEFVEAAHRIVDGLEALRRTEMPDDEKDELEKACFDRLRELEQHAEEVACVLEETK